MYGGGGGGAKWTKIPMQIIASGILMISQYNERMNKNIMKLFPKWLLSIKGRTCNLTPLVHQNMTKKTTLYKTIGEITQVKCKIGLWFLSTALPLINIIVCTKFNFNPFCTSQNMDRTSNHYETRVLLKAKNASQLVIVYKRQNL